MGMLPSFHVDSIKLTPGSYIEGIVRGYRNGLLTSNNYSNLTQCENIDGECLCLPRISRAACSDRA